MKTSLIIAFKELRGYFKSPVAYIILTTTLIVFDIFFYLIIQQNRETSLRDMFQLMEFMFVFFVPLLTMSAFSLEKSAGTIEFLLTSPIKKGSIVFGKFLGAVYFYSFIILGSLLYYMIVSLFGQVDHVATIVGYLGLWLEGVFFIAVGLFFSILTRSQIVAAICSYVFLFLLYFASSSIQTYETVFEHMIRHVAITNHSENLMIGIVQLSDITYFVSGIIVFLLLTLVKFKIDYEYT